MDDGTNGMGSRGGSGSQGRPHGRAAYLGDHVAVGGIDPLLWQKGEVERFAVVRWADPTLRLFVDSGRPDGSPAWSPGMDRLLAAVGAGTVRDVVIARVSVLAPTRAGARRALAALKAAGAVVHRVHAAGGPSRAVRWTWACD